jgi:hypothetical protein
MGAGNMRMRSTEGPEARNFLKELYQWFIISQSDGSCKPGILLSLFTFGPMKPNSGDLTKH